MITRTNGSLLPVALASVVAALIVTGCTSGDDEPAGPLDLDTGAAEDIAQDAVSDPEETYAEITFQGQTTRFAGDGAFACFLTEDGGSMGAVDFSGVSADGDEVNIGWAGDSPDSGIVSLDTTDGTEWTTPLAGGGVTAAISGDTAEVTAELASFTSGAELEPFAATVVCP